MKKIISVSLLAFLSTQCGKKSSDTTTTENSVTNDSTLAVEGIADQLDDVVSAAADDTASVSMAMQDSSLEPTATSITRSRACVVDSTTGGANVTVTLTGSATNTVTIGSFISIESADSLSGKVSRVWTKPTGGSALTCTSSGYVNIGWGTSAAISGLKAATTIDTTATKEVTVTNSRKGTSKKASVTRVVKGNRAITWGAPNLTSTTASVTKTITSDVARTFTVVDKDGNTKEMVATTTIADASPLKITVVRTLSTGAWSSKTVSGTVTATLKSGGKIESVLSSVKYSADSKTKCVPVSGSVTSSIYADGSTTAAKTYTVTFGSSTDNGVSVAEGSATAEDSDKFLIKNCDLESEN